MANYIGFTILYYEVHLEIFQPSYSPVSQSLSSIFDCFIITAATSKFFFVRCSGVIFMYPQVFKRVREMVHSTDI